MLKAFFLIFLISFLANYRTLDFYFYHDDFPTFYFLKNKICDYPWPYDRFCSVFGPLYRLFERNTYPYFLLGIILAILCAFVFYLFLKELIQEKVAFWLSLILASGYFGAANFLFVYSSITTYLSLTLILLSLYFFLKTRKNHLYLNLSLGIIFYFLSLAVFPARGGTYLILAGSLIILWLKKRIPKIPFWISLSLVLLIFLKVYLYDPWIEINDPFRFWARADNPDLSLSYLITHAKYFFQTLSSFLFTEYLEFKFLSGLNASFMALTRLIIGFLAFIFPVFFLFRNKQRPRLFKFGFFGLIWLLSQYLPAGLVTSWGLNSTDRYLTFAYLGWLILLGSLVNLKSRKRSRAWLGVAIFFILFNLFQSNQFFRQEEEANRERRLFYQTLGRMADQISPKSVLFFDAPIGEKARELGDFMRVGYSPSEVAIATALNVRSEELNVITESQTLANVLQDQEFDPDQLFTFYWDGDRLINTTPTSRNLLVDRQVRPTIYLNQFSQTQFVQNEQAQEWSGDNPTAVFELASLKPVIPSQLSLQIKSWPFSPPLPYTQQCLDCEILSTEELGFYFDFLESAKKIKGSIEKVKTSSASEDTIAEYLTDDDQETFWVGERDWFDGVNPKISFYFKKEVSIGGLLLYPQSDLRGPTDLKIRINDQSIDYQRQDKEEVVELIFEVKNVENLTMTITGTKGDRPGLNEIEFIPAGMVDFNLVKLRQVRQFPSAQIKTEAERDLLTRHLSLGTTACLNWQSPVHGRGQVPFTLIADNQLHTYLFKLPSMGDQRPQFWLGCLNYPIRIEIISGRIKY